MIKEKKRTVSNHFRRNIMSFDEKKSWTFADFFHPDNSFIAISGLIGVGKTSLCEAIQKEYDVNVKYEPVVQNPYLSDFYQNEKRKQTSFPMETFLLHARYALQQDATHCNRTVLMDRTLDDDVVFAKMLLDQQMISPRDFATYRMAFHNMTRSLRKPDLIIFLDCEPKIAKERIRQRNRTCESGITLEYLQDLQRNYEQWLVEMEKHCPVLRLNWNQYQSTETVVKLVEKKLKQKIFTKVKKNTQK